MQVSLKVRRYNPERQDRIYRETFSLDAFTVLNALKLLRHVAALPAARTEPCPDISTSVHVAE